MADNPIAAAPTALVRIPPLALEGMLEFPAAAARGLILFAHGSGSSRFSPRNSYVAHALRDAGFATLLFDLLRGDEERNRANVFDIDLLAERLLAATKWTHTGETTKNLPIGYFGASTGAAAALVAATLPASDVCAIVSRGGRPDLAGSALSRVAAPTLLIVGGADTEVIALNRTALRALRCEKSIEIVPGATHLFEEPGTLDAVIGLARDWYLRHLPPHGHH